MRRAIITIAAVILAAGTVSAVTHGKTICVDADAAGANKGTSWADAYKFLQDALADANSSEKPVEIRVAQGVYQPDRSAAEPNGTGDRNATFQLISGVTLKGGYAGFGMPDPNAHDIHLYETILSGDLDGNDLDVNEPRWFFNEPTRRENSFHVVTASGADETAVVDGLSITGGHAYWGESQDQESGGGMYTVFGNPSVVNSTFRDNYGASGGGMYNEESSATVTNCTFQMNGAGLGGGICNMRSEPRVSNCTFTANYVYAVDGGGMYNGDSNAVVTACTFSKNTAWTSGGGMADSNSSTTVTDCIFSENRALYFGGGITYRYGSSAIIKDTVIEGNSANWGGGIYCRQYSLTIKNTVISCTV